MQDIWTDKCLYRSIPSTVQYGHQKNVVVPIIGISLGDENNYDWCDYKKKMLGASFTQGMINVRIF